MVRSGFLRRFGMGLGWGVGLFGGVLLDGIVGLEMTGVGVDGMGDWGSGLGAVCAGRRARRRRAPAQQRARRRVGIRRNEVNM